MTSKKETIKNFQALYLKCYGKVLNEQEAEKVLNALADLIRLATENKNSKE